MPLRSPDEKKRILLVQCGPDHRDAQARTLSFDVDRGLVEHAPVVPLTCATIAALTPSDFHVDIWDENVLGQIRADSSIGDYDIVAVSLMFSSLTHQARFLGALFRSQGMMAVAGGPGISAAPESFSDYFDVLFVNEAERTWPEFLRDFQRGTVKPEYRQIEKPSLTESPMPAWRGLESSIPHYEWGAVQTTRGCPFDCEFCDVIYLFGRRQRHKPVGQVIDEVRALEALGARGVFFTDDEFVGDPTYAKEVLSALIPANNGFRRPLRFYTQATMNLSRDEEILELLGDANFYTALVGIESFNQESIRETHKHQNLRRDVVADVHKIQGHGIGLEGSFIVGFDHDGPETFATLYEGIQSACLPWASVNLMGASHNTKLWTRLRGEGRIAELRRRPGARRPRLSLNVVPAGMSRVELLEGYRDLCGRLHSWEAATARIRGWASRVERMPRVEERLLTVADCDRFCTDATRSWGLSPGDRAAIGDTLEHARRAAPGLINRVVFFLVKNEWMRQRRGALFVGFDEMLEDERRGDLVPDKRPLFVPTNFRPAMIAVFPELFARLYRSLPDEAMLPEAIKDVLVDFVARLGATFRGLEPHHRELLRDLCDRSAARLGGGPALGSLDDVGPRLAEAQKSRLPDAILKDVRDELARIASG